MHPQDWADTAERLGRLFGAVGLLALVFAGLAIWSLRIVWRALRRTEQEHSETLVKLVGANTESHERNAAAQREGTRALGQLGDTMDRLAQSMRDTEEQRRHSLDLILQSRPTPAAPARAPSRRRKGPADAR